MSSEFEDRYIDVWLTNRRTKPSIAAENMGCRAMLQNRESAPLMTNTAHLLTQKQHLLSRLEEFPGPNEQAEIERLLDKIEAELNAVDRPDPL